MKRWPALLALMGLFALGVVAGGLGAHLYYARALDRPPPGPLPYFGRFPGPRLERHLELTPDQRSELREILEQGRREAEAVRRELAPRVHEVMARTDERIRAILTAEQAERFERFHREHRLRSERFFRGPQRRRGMRHPPPPADD